MLSSNGDCCYYSFCLASFSSWHKIEPSLSWPPEAPQNDGNRMWVGLGLKFTRKHVPGHLLAQFG